MKRMKSLKWEKVGKDYELRKRNERTREENRIYQIYLRTRKEKEKEEWERIREEKEKEK